MNVGRHRRYPRHPASNRLELTDHESDAVKIEQDLMPLVPQEDWALWSHLLIHHGRAVCTARNPEVRNVPDAEILPDGAEIQTRDEGC